MSVVNSFSPSTTIASSDVNANFTDIASEITNSVAKDGQSSMTAQFKAFSGTESVPGIGWASDTDTGFRRSAGDTMMVVTGGDDLMEFGAGSATMQSGKELYDKNGNEILGFAATTAALFVQTAAPTGWTKSTSHNDKALRVVSGSASSGGSTAFSTVFAARTILQANLPNVSFTVSGTAASDGAHQHFIANTGSSSTDLSSTGVLTQIGSFGGDDFRYRLSESATAATVGLASSSGAHTHTVSGTAASGGSGTAVDFAVTYVDCIIATKD